jgi:hypothetical protein
VYLPRRLLIFADGQLFFNCRKRSWREDRQTENTTIERKFGSVIEVEDLLPDVTPYDALLEFISSVETYTLRRLAFEKDKLDAFTGACTILESWMKTSTFLGLPIAVFDLALLWRPDSDLIRNKHFPSWSWAGWTGQVYMSHLDGDQRHFLISHTWIKWFRFCDQTLRFVPLREESDKYPETRNTNPWQYQDYLSIQGWPECSFAPKSQTHKDLVELSGRAPRTMSTLPTSLSNPASILRFFTLEASFEIYGTAEGYVIFIDNNRRVAGCLDGYDNFRLIANQRLGKLSVILLSEKLGPAQKRVSDENRNVEGNSDSSPSSNTQEQGSANIAQPLSTIKYPPEITTTPKLGDPSIVTSWNRYNVLLVTWHGEVAYRVAIGWIYKASLADSLPPGPQWKLINLG